MAENKKSFVMYADWIHSIKYLTDEQAGKLLKHLLSYVNDEEPETDDPIIYITFDPIKQQLKRDLEKWDVIRGKRSDAGKKSAEKRAQQKLTSVESVKQTSTNPTVNDNVNVTVNVNDNVIVNDTKSTILNRESEFKNSLQPFLEQYGKDLLNDFYLYWTEKKPKGKKMLFELQKTFDIERRLARWSKNNFNNKNNGISNKQQPTLTEAYDKFMSVANSGIVDGSET